MQAEIVLRIASDGRREGLAHARAGARATCSSSATRSSRSTASAAPTSRSTTTCAAARSRRACAGSCRTSARSGRSSSGSTACSTACSSRRRACSPRTCALSRSPGAGESDGTGVVAVHGEELPKLSAPAVREHEGAPAGAHDRARGARGALAGARPAHAASCASANSATSRCWCRRAPTARLYTEPLESSTSPTAWKAARASSRARRCAT